MVVFRAGGGIGLKRTVATFAWLRGIHFESETGALKFTVIDG